MSKNSTTSRAKKPARTKRITKPKTAATKAATPRPESKQSQLIAMLKRPDGATIAEVVEALQWQPHTVRGSIAGALKKKLGLTIESEKTDDRGRVYRIAG